MKAPLQEDLVKALRRRPMSIKQAAAAVMSTPNSVQEALAVLVRAGRVRRHGFTKPPRPCALFEVVPRTAR